MNDLESRINTLVTEKQFIEDTIEEKEQKLKGYEEEKEAAQEAKVILQIAAKETQKNIELHFSSLITKALHVVFDEELTFQPEFIERRNKTECDFWILKNDKKMRPEFSVGGGVLDVISFATRLSYWKLENKFYKTSPIIILDEPFKNLSRKLLPRAADMLRYLTDKLNLQMLIITHSPEITKKADKIFRIDEGIAMQASEQEFD